MTPCLFYLQSSDDHASPCPNPPATVQVWTPGTPTWRAAAGPIRIVGVGWWALAPSPADLAGGPPMLLYATGIAADPTPVACDVSWPDGQPRWSAGGTPTPVAWWMGTTDSGGYDPAVGLTPSLALALAPSPPVAAAGPLSEPGNGFYIYVPVPGDLSAPGIVILVADASPDAVPATWEMPVAVPGAPPGPPPPPPPPPAAFGSARLSARTIAPPIPSSPFAIDPNRTREFA